MGKSAEGQGYWCWLGKKKNKIVNSVLGNLSNKVDGMSKDFEERMDQALKNIENQFKKSIKNLKELIIKDAGLNF